MIGWFVWEDIHEIERREFAEFFSESSITRTPKVYKEYRDFIINKYREDSSKRLTFTSIRKYLVGDVNLLRKVFLFLENWGLINYLKRSDDGSMEESEAKVEQGTPAGIRVTATPVSMRPLTVPPLVEERAEPAFKFSPLTSYSDVFTDLKKPLVCGHCGGESSCDSAFYQHTKVDLFCLFVYVILDCFINIRMLGAESCLFMRQVFQEWRFPR